MGCCAHLDDLRRLLQCSACTMLPPSARMLHAALPHATACTCRKPANPTQSVPAAVAALSRLLRERPTRFLVQRASGVQLLAPLLRSGGGSAQASNQLLYDVSCSPARLLACLPAHASARAAVGDPNSCGRLLKIIRGCVHCNEMRSPSRQVDTPDLGCSLCNEHAQAGWGSVCGVQCLVNLVQEVTDSRSSA